LKFWLNILVHY